MVITEWGAQSWGTETAFFWLKNSQKMCPGFTPKVLPYLMPAKNPELVQSKTSRTCMMWVSGPQH